jgi:predicted NUDIX family NTP pyrophosphohydrolase
VAVDGFNVDGDPDLAVANRASGNVSVLLGGPGGTFTGPTDFPADQQPTSVAVGDFDADGDPDLAVANSDSSNVSVLVNDSNPAPGA